MRWLLVFVNCLLLCNCGGFEVKRPSDDHIVYILNDNEKAEVYPSDVPPYPMPVLTDDEIKGQPTYKPKITALEIEASGEIESLTLSTSGQVYLADLSKDPFTSFGKLNFTEGKDQRTCTYELIGPEGDVALTAAHCVFSQNNNRWNSKFVLKHGYDGGLYSPGYGWQCVAVFTGWLNSAFAYDYAFIKTNGIGKGLGLKTQAPQNIRAAGYPINYFSTQKLVYVDGAKQSEASGIVKMAPNPLGGGSSGGAWMDNNYAVGLNSFKRSSDPNSMYGPLFDSNTRRLYDFVKSGCSDSVEPIRNVQGVIEADQVDASEFNRTSLPGLLIKKNVGQSCECKNGVMMSLHNSSSHHVEAAVGVIGKPDIAVAKFPLAKGGQTDLGCSVQIDASGVCKNHQFYLKSAPRIKDKQELLPSVINESNLMSTEFCRKRCTDNSIGYCEPLGAKARPIIKSLSLFIDKVATTPPTGEIVATIPDMVKEFGADPNEVGNPCSRSSFISDDLSIVNDGVDCKVISPGVGQGKDPLKIVLDIPTQARSELNKNLSDTSSNSRSIFSNRRQAPVVLFSGEHSQEINEEIGGVVMGVERINSLLIITTESGCMKGNLE